MTTQKTVNLVVADDNPEEDVADIWKVSYELDEPCFTTCLADLVSDSKQHVSNGYRVLLHGGYKTFHATLEDGFYVNVQWMPNSRCC